MSKQEILVTPYGEMMDMLACLSIYSGTAKQKKQKMSFDEVMRLN